MVDTQELEAVVNNLEETATALHILASVDFVEEALLLLQHSLGMDLGLLISAMQVVINCGLLKPNFELFVEP